MERLYYDKKTGLLCNRLPTNFEVKDESCYIDVSSDVAKMTYSCVTGQHWAVINNELTLVDYETTESRLLKINNKLAKLKAYLAETDYIVSKISEASFLEKKKLKKKYKEVLSQRQAYRQEINELEKENNL